MDQTVNEEKKQPDPGITDLAEKDGDKGSPGENDPEARLLLRRRRRRRRRILLRTVSILLVCAIGAGAVWYWKFWLPQQNEVTYIYKETTVQRGDLDLGTMESGTVSLEETSVNYDLNLDTDDDDDSSSDDDDDDEDARYLKIEEVYVSLGQRIEEGDPLFKLTDSSVSSVRRILQSDVSDAAVDLAEAQSDYSLQSQEAANTAGSSETAAAVAQDQYDVTVEELQNEMDSLLAEIDVLTRDIETCQENLADEDYLDEYEDAKDEYETARELFEDTDTQNTVAYVANQQSYLQTKSALETYEDQIDEWNDTIDDDREQIEEDQAKYQEYAAQLNYKQTAAAGQKTSSEIEGQLASQTYQNTVNSLAETVSEAQSAYDEAEKSLEDFNDFVGDDNIIYADGSGLVTAVNYEAGDELASSGTMLTYTKSDGYTITVDISEEDIPEVSVGEQVSIVFTAYPDETASGTVSVISTSASSDHQSTVSYPVTITIDSDTSKLYGGMTADVTFVTQSVEDAVYVSSKAIVEQDGGDYVYVKKDDGTYELKQVTTGLSDGTNTQITDGLSEGDTVYIRSQTTEDTEELKDSSDDSSGNASEGTTETSGEDNGAETGNNSGDSSGNAGDGFLGGTSGGQGGGMPGGGTPGAMPQGN